MGKWDEFVGEKEHFVSNVLQDVRPCSEAASCTALRITIVPLLTSCFLTGSIPGCDSLNTNTPLSTLQLMLGLQTVPCSAVGGGTSSCCSK